MVTRPYHIQCFVRRGKVVDLLLNALYGVLALNGLVVVFALIKTLHNRN